MRSKMHSWKKMSKIAIVTMIIVLLAGCDLLDSIFNPTPPVAVTSVSIAASTDKLSADSTLSLTAQVSPTDATNPSLTWSSSNESVATVDASGVVTPVGFGVATITATSVSHTGVSDSRVVRVGYTETFTNAGNWSQTVDTEYKNTTANGVYTMERFERDGINWSYARMPSALNGSTNVRPPAPFEVAVDISVDASSEEDNDISAGGVVFNVMIEEGGDYTLDMVRILSNGQFIVSHYNSKVGFSSYQTFTASTAIKTDGSANRLVVVQGATSFTAFVNGEQLGGAFTNTVVPSGANLFALLISEDSSTSSDPVSALAVYDNLEIYPTAN